MDVRGALFVGVLQQPVDDVHDVLVVGIDVAGAAQLHQLLEAGQGGAGLAAHIATGAAHRAGHPVELHGVTVQVQRVDHRQLDAAAGQVLQVTTPFLHQRLAGGYQHALGIHRQRQEAVAAGVGMRHQRGHRSDVHPGRVDAQVTAAGALRQPLGQAFQGQFAAAGGGQLEVGQQHQRMHFTGVARALCGKPHALAVLLGHQAIGGQGRGNLLEMQPSPGQRDAVRLAGRACRQPMFHLPAPPGYGMPRRSAVILAHPLAGQDSYACPRPRPFRSPSRA
ncbi:hypothetical protein VM57_19575 [Stenotrophomonas maltophilia]|uniref:Uncharacterized protein n=1 Tax=Stenotrophomonas maltophilia TaxID=40324 RepID=A0A0F5ZM85_STEMA|nr:hypothetical protein VM57_19575 [Stenotrophomonas maltophilia]